MMKQIVAALLVVSLLVVLTESRYLPTRSNDDRILRLRQLLKDLFENEFEGGAEHQMVGYEPRLYKREAYERSPQYFLH